MAIKSPMCVPKLFFIKNNYMEITNQNVYAVLGKCLGVLSEGTDEDKETAMFLIRSIKMLHLGDSNAELEDIK